MARVIDATQADVLSVSRPIAETTRECDLSRPSTVRSRDSVAISPVSRPCPQLTSNEGPLRNLSQLIWLTRKRLKVWIKVSVLSGKEATNPLNRSSESGQEVPDEITLLQAWITALVCLRLPMTRSKWKRLRLQSLHNTDAWNDSDETALTGESSWLNE